jgi:hypothetical protein
MLDAETLLDKLADCDRQLQELTEARARITEQLKTHVLAAGPVEGYGYRAHYKAGRKTTDHEKAATENAAPEDLVLKYTKTKITTTTEWAKVTKDMGINLVPYTTQGDPTFVVEQATPF